MDYILSKSSKTAVIIVLYYPQFKIDRYQEYLVSDFEVILMDNSPTRLQEVPRDMHYIHDPTNSGIAAAFNRGIKKAISLQCVTALLLDQDSYIDAQSITNMEKYISDNTFIIAPDVLNENNGFQSEMVFSERFSFKKGYGSSGDRLFQCISSGSLINLKHINTVGYLNELLFIDWVDFEWCWRTITEKLDIVFCDEAKLKHKLGDNRTSLAGVRYNKRDALRYRYILRNGIYLALYSRSINIKFRLTIIFRCCLYFTVYALEALKGGKFKILWQLISSMIAGMCGTRWMGKIKSN